MSDNLKMTKIRGNLNIVLNEAQINHIIKAVLGPKGENLGNVALASDHCCVDASVGSSVAGPYTGVASSVSVPSPEGKSILDKKVGIDSRKLTQKIAEKNLGVKVTVPSGTRIK